MRAGLWLFSSIALASTALLAEAARPDDPGAPVAGTRYRPVISGTKRYRPVEPLPWGEVNKRVTPPPKKMDMPMDMPKGKGEAPASEHKH